MISALGAVRSLRLGWSEIELTEPTLLGAIDMSVWRGQCVDVEDLAV